MKTVTFYSGKLWHSDKPFPAATPKCQLFTGHSCIPYGHCGCALSNISIQDWLSTAYEVVNPEVIPGIARLEKGGFMRFLKDMVDGDQITLPEGYGIKHTLSGRIEFKEVGHSEATTKTATIITPEKPENTDKIFIDGDFNDSYESRVRRAKVKKIEGLGNEKFDVHQVDSQNVEFVEKVDSVQWQDIMTTAAGVEPSESQEEMWKEVVDKISKTVESYVNEFIDSSSEQMRDDLRADLEELNGKFTITRK